jgi:hypothetical protein
MRGKYSVIIGVLLVVNFGFSQTIATDRPDQTESSSVIPKGSFQIESGILVGFTSDDIFSEQQLLLPTTLFRISITKGIELRVLSQFESTTNKTLDQTSTGISDLEVGTKVQIFKKQHSKTEIAFLSHLVIPTGTNGLTNNSYGTVNKLAVSHVLSGKLGVGYNIGYSYFGEGNGDLGYSLSFAFRITNKLGVYAEPYGALLNIDTHESNFDAGFTYLIQDNFQLDFSFGTGINHNMNYLALGASVNIH